MGRDSQIFSTYACVGGGGIQLPVTTRGRFPEGRHGLCTLEGTRLI